MKRSLKLLIFTLISAIALSFGILLAGCGGKVTLSFDAGEGSPVESITAEAGDTVELPSSLRKGYVLAGWSAGGETLSGNVTVPDKDTSYTAVWAQGYEVTFDADGGVYAEGAPSLILAEGANIYDAVKNIAPTKSGLDFGAWFLGDAEIVSGVKMPAENITLTAKYKVEYVIERYLLNLAGNSYVRDAEILYASDYVDAIVSPRAPEVTGFAQTAAPAGQAPIESVRLVADASKNVLRFYYDRLRYEVVFNPDSSQATGSVASVEALYGDTVALPESSFSNKGYLFAGWSAYSGGEADYRPQELFPVMGDTVLYAVWDKGFTDRYGGNDLVFFPRFEPEKAILRRGSSEFEGTRDGDDFVFSPGSGDLKGRVYGSMFSYERNDLVGSYTFMEFVDGEQFTPRYEADRTLTIDSYLNADYKKGSHTCKGAVRYSEETLDYVFESSDETFRFLPMRGGDYDYPATFLVGGEEVGSYIDFVMVDPVEGMGYLQQTMMLIIDGYGVAVLGDMTTGMSYDGRYYVDGIYTIGTADIYKLVCFFSDPDGLLTGIEGAVATNFVYTLPVNDPSYPGYGGYVQATELRGEYEGENGETLVLDGFGHFADSFLYTVNGKEYEGRYSVATDLISGSVVNCETESGEEFSFRVDAENKKFSAPKSLVEGDYTEYRFMDGSVLRPPFLVLHDVESNGLKGKVSVFVPSSEDDSTLIKAAGGTFTAEPIGHSDFFLYTFTRTEVTKGYESAVGEKLLFFNSVAVSTTENLSYNIYCLLEETSNGKPYSYWEKYALPDGSEIWECTSVSTGGLGSLLIEEDGTVTQGQFTHTTNEHFEGSIGTFLYVSEQGEIVYLYYDLSKGDDGSDLATPREGIEEMLYVVQPTGVEAGGVGDVMIFLDGVSRMKYTTDKGENFLSGTYEPVGTTHFGETVYAFKVGGSERFRFVIYTLAEYDDALLATLYDSEFETALKESLDGFKFEGVGSLTIDGYHTALYDRGEGETLRGDYIRDALCQTISFTATDGSEFVFDLDLEARSFLKTDWAVGRSWQLLDSNFEQINNYSAVFIDNISEKIVSIRNAAGAEVSTGTYVVLDTVNDTWGHEEYLLRGVSLGAGYPRANYRVTFAINSEGVGACLVFNADADGVFTDEHWNVLVLDGYGRGEYSTDSFTGTGSYEVIDFEKNFISFTIDESASAVGGREYYFLLSEHTFNITDYEGLAGMFFADDLESISFRADGTAYFGNESGPYYVQNGKAYVYLSDSPTEVDAPTGDVYAYKNKTYRRFKGEAFTMNGTVLLLDKDGEEISGHPALSATLTFAPNGTTNGNLAAVFTFEGKDYLEDGKPKEYAGYSLRLYAAGDSLMGESVGEFSPTVTYGKNRYPISFDYKEGSYTFTVTAGYNSVEHLDHNARYYPDTTEVSVPRGGRLFKTSVGFGAIVIAEPTISGDFLYLYKEGDEIYSKPVHFDDVPEKDVKMVGSVPGYGDRLELTFAASDGKDYLLNYYEYYQGGNYFWCYGLFSYQDVETEKYTVRVKTLLYTKMSIAPGYFDAQNGTGEAIGKISAVTLLDKETKKPVVAYDTGITPSGYSHSVWIVDKADVVTHGTTDTCTWGTGYLVTFTLAENGSVASAEVETYRFAQVVNYMLNLVNLFFDDEGNVVLASVMVYNGEFGRYEHVSMPHDLVKNEDGTFTFFATWDKEESRYTVKVEEGEEVTFRDADGKPVSEPGYKVTVTVSPAD